jgi:hypothetical protein
MSAKTNPFMVPAQSGMTGFEHGSPTQSLEHVQNLLKPRQGLQANNAVYHHETFVVFRPWESCGRCLDAVLGKRIGRHVNEDGEIPEREEPIEELPAIGDRVCPHTRKHEYEQLVGRMAKDGLVAAPPTENILRNGTLIITAHWWEPKKGNVPREQF